MSWTAAYQVLLEGSKRDLREFPSVIGGSEKNRHGIVLAKSIPAKKYKIVTGEPLVSARAKCPGLVVEPPPYLTIPEANQGYGNSVTVAADIRDAETAHMVILSLCETVAARLRADGVKVTTVVVSMVDREFCHFSKQGQMLSYSEVTDDIYQKACRLFDEIWDGRSIRQMGVQTSKVVKEDFYQMNFMDGADYERKRKLLQSVNQVRERYGEDSMMRARFVGQPISHMSGGLDREKRHGITKPFYIEATDRVSYS